MSIEIEPLILQYIEKSKVMSSYTIKNDKYLSSIADFFYDQEAVKKILESGKDPLIYSYHDQAQPEKEGEFSFGITTINPGTIGDEFYKTRGHFHLNNYGEFYMGLGGEGVIILEKQDTHKVKTFYFTKNSLLYIPGGWGHRVVNIGEKSLAFLTVESAISPHDYETVRKNGFKVLVLKDDAEKYKVVPNPKRKETGDII